MDFGLGVAIETDGILSVAPGTLDAQPHAISLGCGRVEFFRIRRTRVRGPLAVARFLGR
jgi:hypothetical protein